MLTKTKQARPVLTFAIILFLFPLCVSACANAEHAGTTTQQALKVVQVVAAENFYGDIIQQLGGSHVSVTSIISNPNIDPHAYESSPQTAIAFSKAQLVIANGGGYDDWVDKLLSVTSTGVRKVLKGFDIAPHKLPNNEHVWYSVDNMQAIANAITTTLQQLDATDAASFERNRQTFDQALTQVQQKISSLKAHYSGTPVGLTETIFLYQTGPIGLKVLTPLEFEKAIAEGNDPPIDTVTTANDQINKKQIKVLIYNQQTITPITTNLQNLALAKHIPIVPVTETMPPNKHYQTWMLDQLNALQLALGG